MAKPKTPNKTPKPRTTDEDPDDLDPDDSEDETDPEDMEKKINAIVTNRVKRALKPFEKLLGDLGGKIDALGKKPATSEDDDDTDDDDDDAVDPAVAATAGANAATPGKPAAQTQEKPADAKWRKKMEKDLREEREKRETAEKAQQAAADKAKKDEERTTIMRALEKAGVTDPKAQRAAYLTMVEDGLVTRDDDGKVCIKSVDKYGDEELVSPGAGAAQWAKSDGKSFMPAVDAGGSGQGGAHNVSESTRKMTKQEYSKLDKVEKAKIELWRASNGMPPLEE